MKRFMTLLLAVLLSSSIWGQAQLTTRKVKFNDFTEKITKVVLTGNLFYDSALKEEISSRWRLSPYEFCSAEEFEQIKGDSDFYFLITAKGQFRKEAAPGINFLSLVKGGKGAEKGISSMLEVISIPLCSTENPDGREMLFLPAFLEIIQAHTELSMQYDTNAYLGLSKSISYMSKNVRPGSVFMIYSEDLAEPLSLDLKKSVAVADEDEVNETMLNATPGYLVSYVVAPANARKGSFSYKMVINAEDKSLFYYKRQRIGGKYKAGFTEADVKNVLDLSENIK